MNYGYRMRAHHKYFSRSPALVPKTSIEKSHTQWLFIVFIYFTNLRERTKRILNTSDPKYSCEKKNIQVWPMSKRPSQDVSEMNEEKENLKNIHRRILWALLVNYVPSLGFTYFLKQPVYNG